MAVVAAGDGDGEAAGGASSSDTREASAADEGLRGEDGGGAGSSVDGGPSGSGRAPHIGLDHPDLKIYLSHNTSFKTDEERLYKVGMIAAMDRKGRTELRKALAAHRLALRDAEAAVPPGMRGPASLMDRMASRLAEMEAEVRRVEGAPV